MNKKAKSKEKTKAVSKPDPTHKVHHKPKKTLPFPHRKKDMSDEELYKSFVDALNNLTFEVPMLKVMQVPTYKKFLRDILCRKRAVPPVETVALIESYPMGDQYP